MSQPGATRVGTRLHVKIELTNLQIKDSEDSSCQQKRCQQLYLETATFVLFQLELNLNTVLHVAAVLNSRVAQAAVI